MEEDTQAPAENVQAVEDNSQDTSPVDETNTSESTNDEGQSDQEQVTAPDAAETKEDSERKPSRAERKIREQHSQIKELNARVEQLQAQPNQFGLPPQQSPVAVEPGQELTPEEYQRHLAQTAQGVVQPQLEQLRTELETKEAKRNFEADAKFVEVQYKELQDDSPIKDVLERQIVAEYQEKAFRLVGIDPVTGQPQYRLDPSVRLADIARQKVDDARAIAEKASADISKAVANDADQTAIKPSGNVGSEKKFEDLSIEEMEKRLGVVRQ